jgi:D-glycero-D-manno-heptose 1,7-bisphosphate phosphatase
MKVIFLDRDGVINIDNHYVYKKKDFVFNDGIFELLHKIKDEYKFIVITNQSGIAKEYFTQKDFFDIMDYMKKEFLKQDIEILDIFYCPHKAEDYCKCRKPNIGMIEKACRKYDINLAYSWFIGDNITDMQCANNANIKNKILINKDIKSIYTNCYKINTLYEALDIIK